MYKDLDGKKIKWKAKSKTRKNASKPHKKAVDLIKDIAPNIYLCEECLIKPGKNYPNLYLDIYIPTYNLAIEIDGGQHDSFNLFFHKTIANFHKQKRNDLAKEEWCNINNITFIRLKEKDSIDEWREQIISCYS